MHRPSPHLLSSLIERLLPWIVLAVLLVYTRALLVQAPYAGFYWQSNGRVGNVYVSTTPANVLQKDDQLVQVGFIAWNDYVADLRQTLFADVRPGQIVPIVVERQGLRLRVDWVFPGSNPTEFEQRLFNVWPAAYVFWLAGAIAILFARPRDTHWRLLVAFNFLTALWLMWGNISILRELGSAILFRVAIWLSVPVYLHLHWIFPQPLGRAPGVVWPVAHLAGIALAIAQWFQWVPPNLYALGFTVAILGSFVLLIAHIVLRPSERGQLRILVVAGAIALAAPIVTGILTTLTGYATSVSGGFLLTMPILPAAYLYATYRRQLGALEFRANMLLSTYLFFVLLSGVILLAFALADPALSSSEAVFTTSVTIALGCAALGVSVFDPFRRFVEHHVLGIRFPSARLIERYIAQITTSPTLNTLADLLQEQITPSLLIRQSALVRCDHSGLVVVYTQGVGPDQIPADAFSLLTEVSKYRPPGAAVAYPWIRLILPLSVEQKLIGLWLLGRRDPDDYYAPQEISTLQSLAGQTAIALTNIYQADRLRALYQYDIDQREAERLTLARELHDSVLQQLASLKLNAHRPGTLGVFDETYEVVVASLRHIIGDLRPAMLNYGLGLALSGLVDELSERTPGEQGPVILLELTDNGARYEAQVEQHVYRIVQQACENALRHANAKSITLRGRLEPRRIELLVEDDGVGFPGGQALDPSSLMADKHFGLAGMMERASLINASLLITSVLRQGTKVSVSWANESKYING